MLNITAQCTEISINKFAGLHSEKLYTFLVEKFSIIRLTAVSLIVVL